MSETLPPRVRLEKPTLIYPFKSPPAPGQALEVAPGVQLIDTPGFPEQYRATAEGARQESGGGSHRKPAGGKREGEEEKAKRRRRSEEAIRRETTSSLFITRRKRRAKLKASR